MRILAVLALVAVACGRSSSRSAEECRDLRLAYEAVTADPDLSPAAQDEADRLHDEWWNGGCDETDDAMLH